MSETQVLPLDCDKRKFAYITIPDFPTYCVGAYMGSVQITELILYREHKSLWLAIISNGQLVRRMPASNAVIDYELETK